MDTDLNFIQFLNVTEYYSSFDFFSKQFLACWLYRIKQLAEFGQEIYIILPSSLQQVTTKMVVKTTVFSHNSGSQKLEINFKVQVALYPFQRLKEECSVLLPPSVAAGLYSNLSTLCCTQWVPHVILPILLAASSSLHQESLAGDHYGLLYPREIMDVFLLDLMYEMISLG